MQQEDTQLHHKHIEQLTEKGWQFVQIMLDRERPVHSHRSALPYAAALLFLFSIGAALWWWMPVELGALPILPVQHHPIADVVNHSTDNLVLGSEYDFGNKLLINDEKNSIKNNNFDKNNIIEDVNLVVENRVEEAIMVSDVKFTSASRFIAPLRPISNRDFIENYSIETQLKDSIGAYTNIDLIHSVTDVVPIKRVRSQWQLGIISSVLAGQVKSLPSLMSGLQLHWQPKGCNWNLQAGIGYRFQRLSGENRPFVPVEYKRYVNATGSYGRQLTSPNSGSSLTYIASANRVLVPLDKAHYLELPVQLNIRVLPRLQMQGGLTFSRLLRVESADRSLFTYNLNILETPNQKADDLDALVKSQLPAWETSWQSGLGYSLGRHWEVSVQYRQVWQRKPALANTDELETCYNCNTLYPEASRRTQRSVRPQAIQLSTIYKF
jgi:hypothetical protein